MSAVCVVGSMLVDHVVRVPRWPAAGETVRATAHERALGGKGFNQAVAAARAGAVVTMVGAVGHDDAGAEFLAFLDNELVDTRFVDRARHLSTGFAVPVVEEASVENAIVIVPLANDIVDALLVRDARPAIEGADVLGLQLELGVDVAAEAAALARASGTAVVLNAAPAVAEADRLRGLVDHLVVNEPELRTIAGPGDVVELAHRTRERWSTTSVIVTLGAEGVVAVEPDGELVLPGHRVECIDSVGAGDAFCGTLLARLADGDDVAAAVRLANAAGALAVTATGAGPAMPWLDEVRDLLAVGADR